MALAVGAATHGAISQRKSNGGLKECPGCVCETSSGTNTTFNHESVQEFPSFRLVQPQVSGCRSEDPGGS